MQGRLIEENLLTKHRIIGNHLPEGQRIHDFLSVRARALAGDYIDFDETPVTFVLIDSDDLNAFYVPAPNPDPRKKPRRSDMGAVRYVKNPLDTHVIGVTRGLIEAVDNLDQLDFVLGHELTHMIMRGHGIQNNSKGEEEIADLHAVDLMYDAGSDPKQALLMSEKISAYAKEQRKKEEKKPHIYGQNEKDAGGIDWSQIFDVHMSDDNREAGIKAALTRLSHLIDDRTSSPIDKSLFDAHYSDPVDVFLQANDYARKEPFYQLKILIDCIDHLSEHVPAKIFFQEELDAIPEGDDWMLNSMREHIQKCIDGGYTDYFSGLVIEKKYQQKIANMTEEVIRQAHEKKQKKSHEASSPIDAWDLNAYLQNKAYTHISDHGYPEAGDLNYLSASGVLYSYFYHLLDKYSPDPDSPQAEQKRKENPVQIEIDLESTKNKIRTATTAKGFIQAVDEFYKLDHIQREIRTIEYGAENRNDKLDNLSAIKNYRHDRARVHNIVYTELKDDDVVPWNNLVEIAKTDAKTKKRVVDFLERHRIKDYRITHDLPYVRFGYSDCYIVSDDGKTFDKKIEEYELDFAVNRETVLQAYDYIAAYFDNEAALIDATCAAAINVDDQDFKEFETLTDKFNDRTSIATRKYYDLISLYNSIPGDEEEKRYGDPRTATSLIPEHHLSAHPIPGSRTAKSGWRDVTVLNFSKDLLDFKNPIFQERFGQDFEQTLVVRKKAQQQQIFDAAFIVLQNTVDAWLGVKPKREAAKKRERDISSKIWNSSDEDFRNSKEKELELAEQEHTFYKEKEETTESLISNILYSIFEDPRRVRWQLNRLTEEQKRRLGEFAVRDEKGAVRKLSRRYEGYEVFCDYLGILEEQINQVISGNYEFTDMMRIVSENYGHQSAQTKEELDAFISKNKSKRYSREDGKYAWYLNTFDLMQRLQVTPEINVTNLAIAIAGIKHTESSSIDHEIVEARRKSYRTFIKDSDLTVLIARAIDYQKNYEGLNCSELLEAADALTDMRKQLGTILEGEESFSYFGEKKKSEATPEQQKFLKLIEKNVRGLLRKAEHQALQSDNALEKITDLYRTYNAYGRYYSDGSARDSYLREIDKKEGRLKNISTLCEEVSFWPEDALEHVKAYVFAKNTFLDNKELEDKILNNILAKLEGYPAGKKKNECLSILLDQNLRAAYPETRDRLFAVYTDDVAGKLGKDDGSEKYQTRLAAYLNALQSIPKKDWDIGKQHGQRDGLLSNSIAAADKYLLMRCLSDAIISQEQTSKMIKESCQVKLNSKDMVKSYLYGIGVDYLTQEMDRDVELANKFIGFFNSKGEQKDCSEISTYIEEKMKKKYTSADEKDRLGTILKNTKPTNCKILYENFWSAPLEARAVIIARMLKSAANDNQNQGHNSWENVFDIVMDNLISSDDNSVEAKYARDIMHSYIKSRSDYERELIMSAMMVANRNIGNDKGNIGKALKLFLENMGPAEIKLGQAIASHPDTPESIKRELQKLKSEADMPPRWTLYDWIKSEKIPEEYWKDEYLGEILGSASYYTTVALGEDKVLRILRPEAREKAAKGFKVIRSTVDDLKQKDATSDLSYRELTFSVQEMVTQAAKMSGIETDHDLGQKQYEYAKEIYNGVTITISGHVFPLKVMDWVAKGENWSIMNRAKGPTFNAIPEDTPEQVDRKRHFAKAYVTFELINILSGKKFDHDKHGEQLSIDPATNLAGIYDTGAMTLHDPSQEDQKLLGNVIYEAIKDMLAGNDTFASFSNAISKRIETLHQSGMDTQYLVEVKKGLLALGDFFKILQPSDVKDILPSINLSDDLSEDVQRGITEKMSMFEKAQYKAFLAIQSAHKPSEVAIQREHGTQNDVINVANVTVTPETQGKSGWLWDKDQH